VSYKVSYMWNNVNCRQYGKAKSTTAKTIARTVIIHVSYIKSVNIRIIINNFTVHKTSKLSKTFNSVQVRKLM